MKLNSIPLPAALVLTTLTLVIAACGGDDDGGGDGRPSVAFGLHSEFVATADRVSEIAFAPDDRVFFAEQLTGNIRVILADGTLQEEPFATVPVETFLQLDWGLTGLALDPDFDSNGYVYAYYTNPVDTSEPPNGPTAQPTIVRFTDEDGVGTDETVIADDFPVTPVIHPGFNGNGKIHFGPDGFLYVSVGDYDDYEENPAQDLAMPIGKLLRIDPSDGLAAEGNPFADDADADPRVYAYGFREPFDFTFHPETGVVYASDNTAVSCEEINIIEAGENYGWRTGDFPYSDCSVGEQGRLIYNAARDGMQPGDFLSFVEISALEFAVRDRYPTLGDALIVCESWRSEADEDGTPSRGVMRRVVLSGADLDTVETSEEITRECRGNLSIAPDGTIYYASDTEVRKLEIGEDPGGGDDGGSDQNGSDDGDDTGPTQPVPLQPTQ